MLTLSRPIKRSLGEWGNTQLVASYREALTCFINAPYLGGVDHAKTATASLDAALSEPQEYVLPPARPCGCYACFFAVVLMPCLVCIVMAVTA